MGWFGFQSKEEELQRVIGRLIAANERLIKELPEEMLSQLSVALEEQSVRDISGSWGGAVDGNSQSIQIDQSGNLVNLEGRHNDNSGIGFKGKGKIVSHLLVFSWTSISPNPDLTSIGVNVMTLSAKGDVLDGKYFGSHGAVGPERYVRR